MKPSADRPSAEIRRVATGVVVSLMAVAVGIGVVIVVARVLIG